MPTGTLVDPRSEQKSFNALEATDFMNGLKSPPPNLAENDHQSDLMKTQRYLALSTLLFSLSPHTVLPARASDLHLTSEWSSNKLTLTWNGASGVRLQKSTCLCTWEYVPNPDSNCAVEVTMNEPVAFFRLVDMLADTDADWLTREEEEAGWTIFVDYSGYGESRLVEMHVTSDPELTDTDDDGLTDFEEWIYGTDPRSADTDHDGLSDYEEVYRYHTSPTSVDTDGDARGPQHDLPPKAPLFDGNELRVLHTSPTLEDTDGDGRTDYEEYDQSGRSPLVAQLPNVAVQLVDAADIRLDVQYAEETGKTFQYGSELSESTTTTHSDYNQDSIEASLTLSAQYRFGLGGGWTVGGSVSFGYGHVWSTTDETAKETQSSFSQYNTDSRTRTETSASGSISGGIRLVNTGPVTYTLTDFGVTVRYWMPADNGTNGQFKTLATLVPALGVNGITLAPGDSTPVLQVQATGLNASRVKEFMARPNSLYLEPAFYELENAEGLNFDFIEEVTRWRTARVQIDAGDGQNEEYRIATNVERDEDGGYAGITLGNVMSNLLHIPFQTVPRRTLQTNSPTNERILFSVRDLVTTSVTNGFWIVGMSGAATTQDHPNFEDILLHAGDSILLTFIRDQDGDGLYTPEEQHFGTSEVTSPDTPPPSDSDGDGLSDVFEARTGWDVVVLNRTNHVYSDPRQADQDNDGLTDLQEFQLGTDPTRPDTDSDGLPDAVDPHPLVPAKVLRVKQGAIPGGSNGATWATAFTNLQDALSLARAGAATGNADDDVAEIWVAAGVYKPTASTNDRNASFELVNNTAIYGGFAGVETKLSQRQPDPLLNDTILSGDLLGNDTTTPWDNPATYNDNSIAVCRADTAVGDGTVLDGFTITGGNAANYGGGLFSYGRPRLKNLFFRANYGVNGAGVLVWLPTATAVPYVISDCLFLQNGAGAGGAGGMLVQGQLGANINQPFVITNCHFYQNAATAGGGGGGLVVGQGVFEIKNCTFAWNVTATMGGGIAVLRPATARISRCQFLGNTATNGGSGLWLNDFLNQTGDLKVEVLQSLFWGNSSPNGHGAILASGVNATKRLYVLNSTLVSNVTAAASGTIAVTNGAAWIENSILWGNASGIRGAGLTTTMRTTCLPDAGSYLGGGNINADPKFVNSFGGDLRLQADSPCIDQGNNYVDYHPTVPGFQLLPATDITGLNWRVLDGNLDGTPIVDMGAYEFRPQ